MSIVIVTDMPKAAASALELLKAAATVTTATITAARPAVSFIIRVTALVKRPLRQRMRPNRHYACLYAGVVHLELLKAYDSDERYASESSGLSSNIRRARRP